jgi:hypothetical protein
MAIDIADPNLNREWFEAALRRRDREVLEIWLRSDEEITPEFRAFLADVIAGKVKLPKLKRGGQKKRWHEHSENHLRLLATALYVRRLKRVWRNRYGRTYRVHEAAIDKALTRARQNGWVMKRQSLINHLRRSERDHRKRM